MASSLVVHLNIDPEKKDEFIEIVRAHGKRSVQLEEGCISFQVMLPQEEPYQVILVEIYQDDEAITTHWNSKHMANYREKTKDMIIKRQLFRCIL